MTTKQAKENIMKNWRANYTADHMDNHNKEVFLLNAMEQLENIAKDEFVNEYTNELKQRNRIIAVLLDKLGGQARVFDYELLNLPEKSEGELTSYRAALVNAEMFSSIAAELGLNEYLLLSRGERKLSA